LYHASGKTSTTCIRSRKKLYKYIVNILDIKENTMWDKGGNLYSTSTRTMQKRKTIAAAGDSGAGGAPDGTPVVWLRQRRWENETGVSRLIVLLLYWNGRAVCIPADM
jgi:hypothetical protein